MTTYSAHYVLTAHEIPIYRHLLEKWASTATGESVGVVERLLRNTCDVDGSPLSRVEEYIRIEKFLPFWEVMEKELQRMYAVEEANRKLPFDERDLSIFNQVHQLEEVIKKLRATEMSSTFSGITRDR
jgi:hypothetical protein